MNSLLFLRLTSSVRAGSRLIPSHRVLLLAVATGVVVSSGCRERAEDVVEADASREATADAFTTYPSKEETVRPATATTGTGDSAAARSPAVESNEPLTGEDQERRGYYAGNPETSATAAVAQPLGTRATDPHDTGPRGFAEADTLRDQTEPSRTESTAPAQGERREVAISEDATRSELSPESLKERVQQALAKAGEATLPAAERADIEVAVTADRTVVLTGRVSTKRIARQVVDHVKSVEGVQAVTNQLTTASGEAVAE